MKAKGMSRSMLLACAAAGLLLPALLCSSCAKKEAAGAASGEMQDLLNLNDVGTLPVVKNTESFTLLLDSDNDPASYGMYAVLEGETNVHVDLKLYPYQTAVERKNIGLSTGDYTDAIGGWVLTDNDILTMAKEGTIIPLEEYIDKYTVNMKEALAIPGVRESMTLPDGHIYSPPYVIGEPEVTFGPFINTRWLEQVGLPMPKTTGEFKQTLIAFRDNIKLPGGSKPIPFSADPVNMDLGNYAGWWGQPASAMGTSKGYFAYIDGQVEFTATREEYKEAIKYFADLWKEGLIDPELYTQDQTTWKAKGKQNLYGVSIAYGSGDFQDDDPGLTPEQKASRYRDYDILPVLKAGSAAPVIHRNSFGVTLFRTQFVITDKAKNPITILRWLDNVFTAEHSIECDAGPVDVSWEWVEKNATWRGIDLKETKGWSEAQIKPYTWGNYWTPSMPKFKRVEIVEVPKKGQPAVYDELKVRDALYEPYMEKEMLPQVWLTSEQAKKVADLQTVISDYVLQKQAEWIGGQADIDKEWAAFKTDLDRLGLPELLQLKRAAVAATQK